MTWTYMICDSFAVLGKIFTKHLCICCVYTVKAPCFMQGLYQYSWLVSWWTKWFSGITVAKLCQNFKNKLVLYCTRMMKWKASIRLVHERCHWRSIMLLKYTFLYVKMMFITKITNLNRWLIDEQTPHAQDTLNPLGRSDIPSLMKKWQRPSCCDQRSKWNKSDPIEQRCWDN